MTKPNLSEPGRKNKLSPRMRIGVQLYQSGLVPTKKAAAKAAGLSHQTFYAATAPRNSDPRVKQLTTQIDQLVDNETLSTRLLVDQLARKAIGKIGNLMEGAESERVQLDAAKDLADRGSETSKVQKHQVESFSLAGEDAKMLALAMVEAASVKRKYSELRTQDFIRLEGGFDAKERIEDEAGEARQDVGEILQGQAQVDGQEEGQG